MREYKFVTLQGGSTRMMLLYTANTSRRLSPLTDGSQWLALARNTHALCPLKWCSKKAPS